MRCESKTRAGTRCKAMALRTGKRCNFHADPERHRALAAAGGRRRSIYRAENLKHFAPATSAAELAAVVGQTLCDVRNGSLDAKTGNAVGALASCLLSVIKVDSLETRMAAVEKFIKEERNREPRRAH
jgi:hypothetical protein